MEEQKKGGRWGPSYFIVQGRCPDKRSVETSQA